MAKYTGPVCRLCRREGKKLFLKGERCLTDKCAFEKRKYPPGIHGPTARRKLSIYGLQLREKQKAKRIYGVLESQFKRYFDMARKMPGNTGENLLSLLERRLDNVIHHLGFASSRKAARQLVAHGHVIVNGRKVDIPSYLVSEGDVISIREKSRENVFIKENFEKKNVEDLPSWLSLNKETWEGKVLRIPVREDVSHPIKESLIIELYSK